MGRALAASESAAVCPTDRYNARPEGHCPTPTPRAWLHRNLAHVPLVHRMAEARSASARSCRARRRCARNLARGSTLLPLYVLEPALWRAGDLDLQHWQWIRASSKSCAMPLQRGAHLLVRAGNAVDVLADLHRLRGIRSLHSHQETGLEITFARDRAVAAFCRASGIPWHQHMQFGRFARRNRDGWAGRWERSWRSRRRPARAIGRRGADRAGQHGERPVPELQALHPAVASRRWDQAPGEAAGLARLDSFLAHRGAAYQGDVEPRLGRRGPFATVRIARVGNVSMRRIVAHTRGTASLKANDGHTADGLLCPRRARLVRSAPALALSLHAEARGRAGAGVPLLQSRDRRSAPAARTGGHLEAWVAAARACHSWMRACANCRPPAGSTRMRAMLVRPPSSSVARLARLPRLPRPPVHRLRTGHPRLADPDAVGRDGINTLRIYNPVKQGHDQDPRRYVRRWKAGLAGPSVHEPWAAGPLELAAADRTRSRLPMRIVDYVEAARVARTRLGRRSRRRKPGGVGTRHARARQPEGRPTADEGRAAPARSVPRPDA